MKCEKLDIHLTVKPKIRPGPGRILGLLAGPRRAGF